MKANTPFALVLLASLLSSCALEPVKRAYDSGSPTPQWEPRSEHLKRAQAYYASGEFGNSLATLGLMDEGNLTPSEKTEYLNLKGLIRLQEKNYTAAIINFKKARDSNPVPEYSGYYDYNLASAWFDLGKPEEAAKILDSIDASKMAEPDQKKVIVLKEKIKKTPTPPPATLSPSEAPGSLPKQTPPPEVYSGKTNPKKIGLLLPLSGKYEGFGKKVRRSIELAFQSSTDPGLKSFELIAVDAGETPESHLESLKKLVEEEQVIAIIGPLLSKSVDAIRAKAEFYQTPLISLAAVQGKPASSVFSCSVSVRDQVAQVVQFAMNTRNLRRFAVLAPSNKAGEEAAHAFWDEVELMKGEIRGFELYNPDLTDFREPVDKLLGLFYTETREKEINDLAEKRKELNITKKTMKTLQYFNLPPLVDFDAVFIADEAKVAGQIIPTFAYRDSKGFPFLGISSWNSAQLVQRSGELAEGAFFPVAFNTRSAPPETQRFYELYSTTYNAHPGELDAVAFDSAAVLIQALSTHPESRSALTLALDQIKDAEGATGKLTVSEKRCQRKLTLYEVKKGAFEVIR